MFKGELDEILPKFRKSLENWITRRVIVDAAKESDSVTLRSPSQQLYNARTIRARHGTDWCKAFLEAERLKRPMPFNPLQHENSRMTLDHYREVEEEKDPPVITPAERRETKLRRKKEETLEHNSNVIYPETTEPASRKRARPRSRR